MTGCRRVLMPPARAPAAQNSPAPRAVVENDDDAAAAKQLENDEAAADGTPEI